MELLNNSNEGCLCLPRIYYVRESQYSGDSLWREAFHISQCTVSAPRGHWSSLWWLDAIELFSSHPQLIARETSEVYFCFCIYLSVWHSIWSFLPSQKSRDNYLVTPELKKNIAWLRIVRDTKPKSLAKPSMVGEPQCHQPEGSWNRLPA